LEEAFLATFLEEAFLLDVFFFNFVAMVVVKN
jgi:hypothetical protein